MSIVNDYLKKIPEPQKTELERIRKIVHAVVPDAVEAISYGIPAFRYKGKYLVGYNALKDHLSLYPAAHAIEAHATKLTAYSLSKGTIRYTLDTPLPDDLIKEIVTLRAKDIDNS